jgi:hypothetical protein
VDEAVEKVGSEGTGRAGEDLRGQRMRFGISRGRIEKVRTRASRDGKPGRLTIFSVSFGKRYLGSAAMSGNVPYRSTSSFMRESSRLSRSEAASSDEPPATRVSM